jgi:hypothetical protein
MVALLIHGVAKEIIYGLHNTDFSSSHLLTNREDLAFHHEIT